MNRRCVAALRWTGASRASRCLQAARPSVAAGSLAGADSRCFASGPHFEGFPFGGGFPGGFQAPRGNSDKYYNVLGIDKNASQDEIKRAYKKAAMTSHPDRGGDEATFKEISKAYSVLSNPEKRAIYDQHGEEALENMEQGGGQQAGANPFDLFEQIFGFKGGGQRQRGKPRTPDSQYELQVTLEDLYRGTTREIVFNRDALCRDCDGFGGHDRRTCPACKGTGVQVQVHQVGPFLQQSQSACAKCAGKGFIIPPGKSCKTCKGRGIVKERSTFTVDVERGLQDGHEFRFRGQADEAPGHDAGDVVIIVRQKPHKVFHRVRDGLVMTKSLTLSEALCGFQFSTTFLDGEQLVVRSASGQVIRPGDIMIIEGKGMPRPHGQSPGDLHLILEVEFPKELSPESHDKIRDVLGGERLPEKEPGTPIARRLGPKASQNVKQLLAEEAQSKDRRGHQQQAECVQQ